MSNTAYTGELLGQIRRLLSYQQALGVTALPRTPALAGFLAGQVRPPRPATGQTAQGAATNKPPAATLLQAIREDLGDCRRCRLHEKRRGIVFGAGRPDAELMIVCDRPNPADDQPAASGSDAADELLTRMLAAIQLNRELIYSTTLIKCMPTLQETSPFGAGEIGPCLPFLRRQIDAVAPRLICAMGPLSAQTLLGTDKALVYLRGRFQDYTTGSGVKIPIMPTFHPGLLLKNPELKKASWEDLQQIRNRLRR
ncbi:MAG: hypothetical protein A2521_03865 [Deltaproteobacteria bacterium RIFOXYD12_FULL_57_12]|nr:MAG: hypothetical protein A2521_03865 [Deltaproteobacteria bacterium RIFOXYD12_FULL_57_12]